MEKGKIHSNSHFPPENEEWTERVNEIIEDFKHQAEADGFSEYPEYSDPEAVPEESAFFAEESETAEEPVPEGTDAEEGSGELAPAKSAKTKSAKAKSRRKKKRKTGLVVFGVIFAVLVLVLGVLGVQVKKQTEQLRTVAQSIESDLSSIIDNSKKLRIKRALKAAGNLESDISEANAILDSATWRMLRNVPVVGEDVKGVDQLLTIAENGTAELLVPALEKLNTLPLATLKSPKPNKANVMADTVTEILTMTEEMLPAAQSYITEIRNIPTFHVDELESKVSEIREVCVMAEPILAVLDGEVFDWVRDDFAPQLCEVLARYPLNKLDAGKKSFNIRGISAYLTLVEENMPKIREAVEEIRQQSAQLPPELSEYSEKLTAKADELLTVYDAAEKYLPLVKCYLKSDEDCDYLLVAQNSAEIRALGGFPGQAGRVTVRDGVLKILDFSSIYKVLPGSGFPDEVELKLFGSAMKANRDACANPHFPTVASRWADDYARLGRGKLAGVVSITPGIIRDLLEVTGEITLLDDTVINSENGVRYLENELYLKYLNVKDSKNEKFTDKIFADAAMRLLKAIMSDLSVEKIVKCISVFEKHCTDRVIMLWLADEEGEQIIRSLGIDGGYNEDPTHPQLGIYFSNIAASKLGWYLDIEPEIGEGTPNPDGSVTYPVTVLLRNTITGEEARNASYYVVKGTEGTMHSSITLAAPAGGTLAAYKDSDPNLYFFEADFKGTQVVVGRYFMLDPEQEKTFRFTVTTAPGEQAPLTYITTPTLTEYR